MSSSVESKDWKIFKEDMQVKAPVKCSLMAEEYEGDLILVYRDYDRGHEGIQDAHVTIKFDSERVFATRKRATFHYYQIAGELETRKSWIFYSQNTAFIDYLKKDCIYDDEYTHYIFVTDTEIIDIVSTKEPKIEEFLGDPNIDKSIVAQGTEEAINTDQND